MLNPVAFPHNALAIDSLLTACPLIRALNFHNTPQNRVAQYDGQLEHCSKLFDPVDENDLDRYLTTGRWHKSRPGLIVAFYNGYRNNYDVLLPLLQRYGFLGWFFVVTGFVGAPPPEQPAFSASHRIRIVPNEYPDGRYALSWNELEALHRCKHIIASHTRHHLPLATGDAVELESEIGGSQQDLLTHLGHPVRSFASFSAPAFGENTEADRLIKAAGYQFVFSALKIQRIREELASAF